MTEEIYNLPSADAVRALACKVLDWNARLKVAET